MTASWSAARCALKLVKSQLPVCFFVCGGYLNENRKYEEMFIVFPTLKARQGFCQPFCHDLFFTYQQISFRVQFKNFMFSVSNLCFYSISEAEQLHNLVCAWNEVEILSFPQAFDWTNITPFLHTHFLKWCHSLLDVVFAKLSTVRDRLTRGTIKSWVHFTWKWLQKSFHCVSRNRKVRKHHQHLCDLINCFPVWNLKRYISPSLSDV